MSAASGTRERSLFAKKRVWLGLIIAAACFVFIFRKTDWAALGTAYSQADYKWFLLALPLYLFGYVLRGVRWHYLLAPIQKVPTRKLLPYLIIGFMANNIFPGRLGEFVRPYLSGKKFGISKSASFATVVLERVFDGLTMLAIFGISSALLTQRLEAKISDPSFTVLGRPGAEVYGWIRAAIFAATFLFLSLLVVAIVAIAFKERSLALASALSAKLPHGLHDRVEPVLHKFVEGLEVLKSKTELFFVLVLSLAAWGLEGVTYYLVAQAFSLEPSFASILMLMAVVNLSIMIPSLPGGLGPFEVAGIGFLRLLSVGEATAKAYVLIVHALILFPITVWGLIAMAKEGISMKQIEKSGEGS